MSIKRLQSARRCKAMLWPRVGLASCPSCPRCPRIKNGHGAINGDMSWEYPTFKCGELVNEDNKIHMKIIGANYIYWYSIGYPIDIEHI